MRGVRLLKGDETEWKTEGVAKQDGESRKFIKKNLRIAFCLFFHLILHSMTRFGCFILKVDFLKKLGTLLNPFAPGNFAEKRGLKLVERFSGHCRAIKS